MFANRIISYYYIIIVEVTAVFFITADVRKDS